VYLPVTCPATSTLEDIRRDKAYDAEDRVSTYLNLPDVKQNIAAPQNIKYEACSKLVDGIMGHGENSVAVST